MSFRDLFNHVDKDTKFNESENIKCRYCGKEDISDSGVCPDCTHRYEKGEYFPGGKPSTRKSKRKRGMKESRMIRRTRINEESFETYYKKFKDKPMLRDSYESYSKEEYKENRKPSSFRKWMRVLWKEDQKNESIKVHENIRKRRKEKEKLKMGKKITEADDKPVICRHCGKEMMDAGPAGPGGRKRMMACPSCDSDMLPSDESVNEGEKKCPECNGAGQDECNPEDECVACGGSGRYEDYLIVVGKDNAEKPFDEDEPVNEDSLLTGGATVPNDPDFANPQMDDEEGLKKELKAEETDAPEEPKEDEREIPLEGDKEYLGNKGGEEYFYFVIIPAEDGTKDLQIQDANDDVVFSAKENEIDVGNTEDFLWKGIQELELSNISLEVVEKYLLPDEKEEDIEMEDVEGPGDDIDKQQSRITPDAATKDSTKEIRTPGGFIPKQGMGESKVNEKAVEIDVKEVQTMVENAKMKKLLEKYNLTEAFETKEEFINFVQNTIIPELEYAKMDDAVKAFYEAIEWMGGRELPSEEPKPEKKYYNIDMDRLYRTGDVGEAKMKELLEKYGMLPSKIDSLMEKFGLVEAERDVRRSPKGIEDLDKMTPPASPGEPSPDILTAPGEEPIAGPDDPHVSADAEPAPEGGEPKAEDMLSSESAEANIKMQYPEEPFTSTALAYADSLVDEPKVYGALRNLKWQGAYANSETFLKQAKIVGNYNEFTPDIAKRLVDAVGDGAKFRLAREGSVAVYFTIRDTDKKISLETLRDLVRADEMEATGNPGEARVWWD